MQPDIHPDRSQPGLNYRSESPVIHLEQGDITPEFVRSYFLDQERPVGEQNEQYVAGTVLIQDWLDYFRDSDGRISVFDTDATRAKIPSNWLSESNLVPVHAKEANRDADHVWVTYGMQDNGGNKCDSMRLSYIARYGSYGEMRNDIGSRLIESDRLFFDQLLPFSPLNLTRVHATIVEAFSLSRGEIKELSKQFTQFHFHPMGEGLQVGLLQELPVQGLPLKIADHISARAYNRVLSLVFSPFLGPI